MKSKTSRKLLLALWGIIFVLLIVFTITYAQNGKLRKNVSKGIVQESDLPDFSFIFPTIYHYNKGNVYYYLGEYDLAYFEYQKSLKRGMKGEKDCKLRINTALSIVTPLDLEYITEDDIPALLESLYEARDLLLLNGCAKEDGFSGHNVNAQILENEIQAWIDALENPQYKDPDDQNSNSNDGNNSNGSSDNNNGNQDQNNDPNNGDNPNSGDNQNPEGDQNQNQDGDNNPDSDGNKNPDGDNDQNKNGDGDQDGNGDDDQNSGGGDGNQDETDGGEMTDEEIERKLSDLTKQGGAERNGDMEYWSGSSEYGYDFSDRGNYW